MIVTRRSYLLSRPSLGVMSAAGMACSPPTGDRAHRLAQTEAERRFAELLRRTGAKAA